MFLCAYPYACTQNLPFSSDGPRGGDGGGGGSGYQSKLEEFSNFLTRARYAPLALRTAPATTLASQRSQTQQPASSSQPALQPAGQQNKGTILGQGESVPHTTALAHSRLC